jgi:hypothetical protein
METNAVPIPLDKKGRPIKDLQGTIALNEEELKYLKEKGIVIFIWAYSRIQDGWRYLNSTRVKILIEDLPRIAAHDYRHYFGEVVDLASKVVDKYLEYLNNGFVLYFDEKRGSIYDRNDNIRELSGSTTECKQWLIDQFTAIAAKDLPNYNLKFIFS